MPLSDFRRSQFRSWGIEVRRDDEHSALLIVNPEANSYHTAIAVLTVCNGKSVRGHDVEACGDTLLVNISFKTS